MENELKKKRVASASAEQKKILCELVVEDPRINSGLFSSSFTKKDAQKIWQKITEKLNAIPGAQKSWFQWRKTWQDLKKNTKSKIVANKRHATGTGGGPRKVLILDETEEKISDLIHPNSTFGDQNIAVPDISFEFIDERSSTEETIEASNSITENDVAKANVADTQLENIGDIELQLKSNTNHSPSKKISKKRKEKAAAVELVEIEEEKSKHWCIYMEKKAAYLDWRQIYEKEKLLVLQNISKQLEILNQNKS